MAYSDASFGFVPVRHLNGAPYAGGHGRWCWVDSSDSTALFIGDPVIIDGTSNTSLIEVPSVGSFPPGTCIGVTRATAGATNRVSGVVTAVGPDNRDSTVYRAASTERLVYVVTDPNIVFRVQADAAVATASVGLNTNILFTNSGDTSTGRSGAEVDATAAADATYQCRILAAINDPENTANAAGNQLEVVFALHTAIPAGGILGV